MFLIGTPHVHDLVVPHVPCVVAFQVDRRVNGFSHWRVGWRAVSIFSDMNGAPSRKRSVASLNLREILIVREIGGI